MNGFHDKRFVVVAGKGGVGRTLFSLVLGLWASRQGKRVLVCLANAGTRYRHLLGRDGAGEIVGVADNLDLLDIDPVKAREEYGLMALKSRILHKVVFSNRYVNTFLDAVPGLAEWAMLGKATYHALDDAPADIRYDMVIFDSPATGHGLDILRLPAAIVRSVQSGRMREEALLRLALLKDATQTLVVPVALAEEGPVNETMELVRELRAQGLPLSILVVNRLVADVAPGRACPVEKEGIPSWAIPWTVYRMRCVAQQENLARLESLGLPLVSLPELGKGDFQWDMIEELVTAFTDSPGFPG